MDVPGKSFNKDLLLSWLLHHMSMETRLKMSAELPAAYNDVMQARVVATINHDDLELGRDGLRRLLRHANEINGGCSASDDIARAKAGLRALGEG
jgi:hypothetical protein